MEREASFAGINFFYREGERFFFRVDVSDQRVTQTAYQIAGAFIVHVGNGLWRFVDGRVNQPVRHVFSDDSESADVNAKSLSAFGIPIVSLEEAMDLVEEGGVPLLGVE